MGVLDVWEIRGYKVYLGVATEVVAQYKQDVDPSEVWDLKQEKHCQKRCFKCSAFSQYELTI